MADPTPDRSTGTVVNGPFRMTFAVRVVPGGVPEVTELHVVRTDGGPVTAEALGEITAKLGALADYVHSEAVAEAKRRIALGDGGILTITDPQTGQSASAEVHNGVMTLPRANVERIAAGHREEYSRRRRRRDMTPERLAEVARVYNSAKDTGAPTKAVAVFLGTPEAPYSAAQASRWVKAARDAGLIPPLEA